MPVVKETSAPRNPVPEGTNHAICVGVIDLGTQPPMEGSQFSKGPTPKVMLSFEFPDERIEIDGKSLPRVLSREFTKSLHKKAGLRQFLDAWRGTAFTPEELKGFELASLIGVNAIVTIVHNERGYEVLKQAAKLMKGMPKRTPESEPYVYDVAPGALPTTIPEWIRKKIDQSEERVAWAKGADPNHSVPDDEPPPASGFGDDDIPF